MTVYDLVYTRQFINIIFKTVLFELVFLAEFRKRDFSSAIKDFTVTNGT